MVEVRQAETAADLEVVRSLFFEYAESLGVDLGYQGFGEEVAGLPGAYAAPPGRLFLARIEGKVAGCVALRPLADNRCEIKRLYVRPGFRGLRIGRHLADAVIGAAREQGFSEVRLDTLSTMVSAQRLYADLGFREIEPYSHQYLPGTRFYALKLEP